MRAVDTLITAGAESVVLSRQGESALARFGDKWLEAQAPELDPADHRGAGDSMTAGLAAGLRQGSTPKDTLRLACAAGAANVTRHGLGSADADLIPGLTEKVEIHQLSAPKS
jgi:1-phosphofructokinase